MLGRNISYYKSQLKSAAKSGPQFVTIVGHRMFKDEKDNYITQCNGKGIKCRGLVLKFQNENIEHEELYWILGKKHGKLAELQWMFSTMPDTESLLNKQLWIVIRHNILIDDKQNEVKRESEIVHYSVDEQMPNYPQIFEQYDIAAV